MQLGERIRFHRNRLNMSQEELGKQLFVSRQTVSMWEKEQTAPTVDNLVRLAKVFSVTIDELLTGRSETTDHEEVEKYRFQFSREEFEEVRNAGNAPVYKWLMTIALMGALWALTSFGIEQQGQGVVGILFMLAVGMLARLLWENKDTWRSAMPRLLASTYAYEISADSIKIEIYRDGELTSSNRYSFSEITRVRRYDKHYGLQIGGRQYIFRKAEIKGNSILYSYMHYNHSKVKGIAAPSRWQIASFGLCIAAIGSLVLGMMLVRCVSSPDNWLTENGIKYMWIIFTMLPLPIASVIFGLAAKRRGYPYKKNLVAGFIMAALLCIYGSFAFVF